MLVVALAEANAGRITAVAAPGLPGIREGGRYVFYRLTGPVGWVSGETLTSAGQAMPGAVVEGGGLPFIGRTGAGIPYLLPVRPGTAMLRAMVPGQNLAGQGSVTAVEGGPAEAASLPIVLEGAVTTATVTPANGALGVAVSVQVELDATGPLDPDPTNLAKAQLFEKNGPEVAVKRLLSLSGKRLAIIPVKPLETSTEYTFTAAGIEDAEGKPVLVSGVTFKTKDFVAPAYDLEKLVFSFPKQGWVKLTAPKDTLPPFSTILVINAMNGFVGTFMAESDGSVGSSLEARLPATIDDRLFVTITDPQGNVTSFERSQFENPETGETAVGPGGGTVKGPGGVELRLPSGALEKGVRLKIALATEADIAREFTEEQLEKLLPGTTLGSVLKIESQDSPTFEKEVDVVFPLPDFTKSGGPQPTDPKDAYYYVHKKVESKDAAGNPIVLFQVVDEAAVQGEGADAKVVTSSPPFPGFAGPMGGMLSMLLLSWSFDPGLPGKPSVGRIVGKVLRQRWDPDAQTPAYDPVHMAQVSATEADGTPSLGHDGGTIARSATDGTYALWDVRYVGGTMKIVATDPAPPGETREAVAFESLGSDRFKPYPYDARANITFPALPPTEPPPALEVKAFRVVGLERVRVDGIVLAGTPIWFGIENHGDRRSPPPYVAGAEVGPETFSLQGPLTNDPWSLQFVTSEAFIAQRVGTYTFRTTVLQSDRPDMVLSWTFRVVADVGGNVDTVPGPPAVLKGLISPKNDATGVAAGAFVQVAFSEPVRRIPGNVVLEDGDGEPVAVRISGVRSGPNPVVIDPVTSDEDVVTFLTLQPVEPLAYGTRYTVRVLPEIVDLDTQEGTRIELLNPPDAAVSGFTTFAPTALTTPGEGETLVSPGMVVLGARGYLAQNNFVNGSLLGFKVGDPTRPERLAAEYPFAPRPVDVTGVEEEELTGGRLVVVGTGSTNKLKPASLLLFDVSSDERFQWIGASSVVSSGMDGFIARVVVKDGYAYTATMKKGIQVVDLQAAAGAFGESTPFEVQRRINTEGLGYGQAAVVQTIGVPKNGSRDWWLNDVDVADMGGRTIGVLTGEMGIAIADTGISSFLFPGTWPGEIATADDEATLGFSYVSALGRLFDKDLAAVAGVVNGTGGGQLSLAVVDITDPGAPVLLGWAPLGTAGFSPMDVILKGDQVFVGMQGQAGGKTLVVSLASLSHPRVVGVVEGVGGRLSLRNDGILYGSAYSSFGGSSPIGGIRSAAVTPEALARLTRPDWVGDPDMRCIQCPGEPASAVGHPVNVTTGNVFFDQTDGVVGGIHGLEFTRSYNSRNAYRGVASIFGPGWSHSYEVTVTELEDNALALTGPDGVPKYFRDIDGDGAYEAFLPASETSWFEKSQIAAVRQYTRRFRDGSFEIYDGSGRLVRRTDALPSPQSTTLEWESGRLVTVRDPGSRSLRLTYDGRGKATRLSSGATVLADYVYDADERLGSVTYGDGSGYGFTYDDDGQVLEVRDHSGRIVERHTYDGEGRALTSEVSDGQEKVRLEYNELKTVVRDAAGDETTYNWRMVSLLKVVTDTASPTATAQWSYDSRSRVNSRKDEAGLTTTYGYDDQGNLTSARQPSGLQVSATYDAQGRPLRIEGSDDSLTTFLQTPAGPRMITELVAPGESRTRTITYDDQRGLVTAVTDPREKTTNLVWNAFGDLESVTDPEGNTTSYEYDDLGRRTKVKDPLGHETIFTYNERGRVTRVTYPDTTHTDSTYDRGGRLETVADTLERTTTNTYDPYGRLWTVRDPMGGTTTYEYNAMSRLAALTDAEGNRTGFGYDAQGRPTWTTDPKEAVESYTYDAAGRLQTRTDRRRIVTTYTYDDAGRLKEKTYSDDTPPVSFSYDSAGRMLSAANGADSLAWTYDLTGQLLTQTSSRNGSTVSTAYDLSGNRKSLRLDGTELLTYAYDDASRLTGITQGGNTFTLRYDAASRRKTLEAPNGITSTYRLDNMSRLLELTHGTVARSAYGYNAVGDRTSKTTESLSEAYGYDPLSRLTSVDRGGIEEAHGYDAVGNRKTAGVPPAVTTATYGPGNQLLTLAGAVTASYSYDANGNLVSKVDGSSTWGYEWTAENELERVTKDGAEVARFAYDPLGRRVEKVAGGVTYRYLYDGQDILKEARTNGSVYTYVHGPGIDEPLARIDQAGSVAYYHADGLGSIVKVTDATGVVLEERQYDAWGNLEVGADQPGYAFTGREWDPETGLYYYRARYYDPRAGRFLSEDPIRFEAGPNFYAYVRGNPVGRIDPTGLADGGFLDQMNPFNLQGSLAQTGTSIWDSTAGMATGDWARVAAAGATNPLGQTENGPGWAYYGTRGSLAVSGTAAAAAGYVMAVEGAAAHGFCSVGRTVTQRALQPFGTAGRRWYSETLTRHLISNAPRSATQTPGFVNWLTTLRYAQPGGGEVALNWVTRTVIHSNPFF
jgi:RHS repeat-associated protein